MPLPPGLVLNRLTGLVTGVPTDDGTYNFSLVVRDALGTVNEVASSIVVNDYIAPTLTGTLNAASITVAYSSGYTRNNGVGPYLFSISAGTLPTGLSIDTATGLITGTPSVLGSYPFTVRVIDALGQIATRAATVVVSSLPVISGTLADGTVGVFLTTTFGCTGGLAPFVYSVFSGSVPAGMSLASSTGVLSGTPTTPGGSTFVIRVTDANGQVSNTGSLTPTIYAVPALSGTLPGGSTGVAYNQTLTRTGGKAAFTYDISAGALPAGLSINTGTGAITGTPTTPGAYTFTVRVIDALGNVATSPQSSTITAQLTLTGTLNSTVILGVPYSSSLTASYGTPPYAFDLSAGVLPTGLSLNASTGEVSGTTNDPATQNFTIRVTDAALNTATSAQSLTPAAALAWSAGYLANRTSGQSYSSTPTVTGGVTPYTFSKLSGTLPPGLSFSSSTGAITGTAGTSGVYNFTMRVADSNSSVQDLAVTITIAAPPSFVNAYDPKATLTVAYQHLVSMSNGRTPITFALQSGSLPNGLTLNGTTGELSGTPTVNATFNFTIRATDANGATVDQAVSLVVAVYPTLPGTYTGTADKDLFYDSTITVSGGHPTYIYQVWTGSIPPGMLFNGSTGRIYGIPYSPPANPTVYNFTIRVIDGSAAQNVALSGAQSISVSE